MKNKSLMVALLLMVSVCGFAQIGSKTTQQANPGNDAPRVLTGLEQRWSQAVLENDAKAVEPLLDARFVQTNSSGKLLSRAEVLANVANADRKLTTSQLEDIRVLSFKNGEVAIVTGRWNGKGTFKGKSLDEAERWTDTWIKEGGRWRCIASQGTLIAK